MKPRPIIEVLIVMGVIGIVVEIAAAHTWIVIAAGVASAFWLLSRSQ